MSFLIGLFVLNFMGQAQEQTKELVQKIKEHPFLLELANGTLLEDKFNYFTVQDNIYCGRYADALNLLSVKASHSTEKLFLMQAAQSSIQEWNQSVSKSIEQCPLCLGYSDFESVSVSRSYHIGLAAIIPCYTVYWEVATYLKKHSVQNNSYQAWINRYADDPDFEKRIHQLGEFANKAFDSVGPTEKQEMLKTYFKSVQFEWQFWNSAYHLITWEPHDNQP